MHRPASQRCDCQRLPARSWSTHSKRPEQGCLQNTRTGLMLLVQVPYSDFYRVAGGLTETSGLRPSRCRLAQLLRVAQGLAGCSDGRTLNHRCDRRADQLQTRGVARSESRDETHFWSHNASRLRFLIVLAIASWGGRQRDVDRFQLLDLLLPLPADLLPGSWRWPGRAGLRHHWLQQSPWESC